MLNEFLLIVTCYLMTLFAMPTMDGSTKYKYGWVFIALVSSIFAINIGFIISRHIKTCRQNYRLNKLDRLRVAARKRRDERLANMKDASTQIKPKDLPR